MSDPWLTDKQVERLTGRKKPAAQARALDEAIPPIPYKLVGGRVIVVKSDLTSNRVSNWEPQLQLVR